MREERDFIGAVEIPDDALYGIHAARARANFPDNTPFHLEWFTAIGMVKRACYTTAEAYFTALNEKYGPTPTPNSSLLTPTSLTLPPCQAGSSIMPGKVNPVIPEFVISAAHTIYANDQLITSLCAQGCLELNAYLPVIGHALLGSLKLLIACDTTLKQNLFNGLVIHEKAGEEQLFRSPAITTALLPYIGYNQASVLAKEMKQTGEDIFQVNERLHIMQHERLAEVLRPDNLLKLGYTGANYHINTLNNGWSARQ